MRKGNPEALDNAGGVHPPAPSHASVAPVSRKNVGDHFYTIRPLAHLVQSRLHCLARGFCVAGDGSPCMLSMCCTMSCGLP